MTVLAEVLQLLNPRPKRRLVPPSPDPLDARAAEIDSIRETVAELQRTQQHEDVDGFVRLFMPDAVWVTAHGKRLTGRTEIRDFTRRVLPGAMQESTATYEAVHVTFVRPDVAVVNVRQRPVTHEGEPLDGQPEGRPLYVMTRDNNGWWLIAAGQNTHVKDE